MKTELPIACVLSERELRARQAGPIREVISRAAEITALEAGCRLRFRSEAGLLPRLAEFIEQERRCCPFLHFALTAAPSDGPIHLTITGPEGTSEFLREAFHLSADGGRAREE